jgi:iduronate 2-sulfatase
MNSPALRLLAGISAALLSLAASLAAADPAPKKLNVLFLISDDLRAELGCYGSPLVQTPNLDTLARAGVRFDRAYCQYPLCNPSRSSMLNGRQPVTTGVIGNRTWFGNAHPDFVSLPKYFKQHGYTTFRSGKIFHGGIDDTEAWTEGGEERRFGRPGDAESAPTPAPLSEAEREARQLAQDRTRAPGSDRATPLPTDGSDLPDSKVADRAIEALRRFAASGEPFFLGCGFAKPHSPLDAPARFFDLYDVAKIPLPPDFAPRPTVPEGFPRGSIRRINADLFIGRDATPDEARAMIRGYLACVSFMDWNVGRVLAELDRLGLRDSTIVVFWGDNGYQLGEKGKWSKAGSLFEQGARIPLIVHHPRAKGNGRVSPRIVESLDLYPTLIDLCGLSQASGLDGVSLRPLLDAPDAPWNRPAYTIWSEDGRTLTGISVRTDRWRYTEYSDGGPLLIDTVSDPLDLRNVATDPDNAAVAAELSALVQAYRARFRP